MEDRTKAILIGLGTLIAVKLVRRHFRKNGKEKKQIINLNNVPLLTNEELKKLRDKVESFEQIVNRPIEVIDDEDEKGQTQRFLA